MAEPAPATPPPRRFNLDDRSFYEFTLRDGGLDFYVNDGPHDAAIFLTPIRIVELRAELAAALIALGHIPAAQVRSPAAHAIAQHFAEGFKALVELDKHSPAEVDELVRTVVVHIRSWRAHVLQGAVL